MNWDVHQILWSFVLKSINAVWEITEENLRVVKAEYSNFKFAIYCCFECVSKHTHTFLTSRFENLAQVDSI
jgi:hypothetical protein